MTNEAAIRKPLAKIQAICTQAAVSIRRGSAQLRELGPVGGSLNWRSPGCATSGTRGRRLISLASACNYSNSVSAGDSRVRVICLSIKLIRNHFLCFGVISESQQ